MKNLINGLIVVAVICTIIAVISRFTFSPVLRIESRAIAGFAGVLLLLAIALSVKK